MSYQLNGRWYHNRADYDRALQEQESKQAREQAATLRRANHQLTNRISESERELERSRTDLHQQIRLNRQIQTDVRALENNQARLGRIQQQLESQMNHRFSETEHEIEITQAEMAELRKEHEAHVQRVRATFQELRKEMDDGLDQAEQRRRETEQRLQTQIRSVDEKVERERSERIEREKDQLGRAEAQAAIAEEIIAGHAGILRELDLTEVAERARHDLAEARRLRAQGRAEAALAVASVALGNARGLESSSRSRAAELEAKRLDLLANIEFLRKEMEAPDITAFFGQEIRRAGLRLDELAGRANRSYGDYRTLVVEEKKDQEAIAALKDFAADVRALTPVLKQQAEERRERTAGVIAAIEEEYGPCQGSEFHFAIKDDPKSAVIGTLDFGGPKVMLRLELDGAYSVDAYNHSDNTTCQNMAHAAATALSGTTLVTHQQTDGINRTTPKEVAERSGADPAGFGSRSGRIP